MKLLLPLLRQRWQVLALSCLVALPAAAQLDEPPKPAEPAPAAAVDPADPPESAEPTEPPSQVDAPEPGSDDGPQRAIRQAREAMRDALGQEQGVKVRVGHGGQAVGVFNRVEVAEDETVDVVVAVLGDYVLKGRSRNEAVAILSTAEVLGPVDGDCVTVLGEIKVEAPVDGDFVAVGSKVYINAPINGDVNLVMCETEFGPNARIAGEVIIVGPEANFHPDAVFERGVQKTPVANLIPPELVAALTEVREYFRHGLAYLRPIAPGVSWCWYIVGFLFLFRLVVVLLFPKPIELGATILRERALRSFLVGLIAYVLYLPAQLLLTATGVGAIAVPFLSVAIMIAAMLGKIALLRSIGGQVGRQLNLPGLDTTITGFLAGTVLVTLIYIVPVLGGVVFLLIKPMALGAMLIAAAEGFRRERPPGAPTPRASMAPAAPAAVATAAFASSATAAIRPATPSLSTNAPPVDQPASPAVPPVISATTPPVIGPGRPRPGDLPPEELMTLPRVGFWPRLGAALLDFILVLLVSGFIGLMNHGPQLFVPLFIAYHVALWTWRGTTLGGVVFSLRLIRLDGQAPDVTVALVRSLASCLSFVVAGLGFFWASWNPDRQSWHDMIAGTVIVKTPRSLPLI